MWQIFEKYLSEKRLSDNEEIIIFMFSFYIIGIFLWQHLKLPDEFGQNFTGYI